MTFEDWQRENCPALSGRWSEGAKAAWDHQQQRIDDLEREKGYDRRREIYEQAIGAARLFLQEGNSGAALQYLDEACEDLDKLDSAA